MLSTPPAHKNIAVVISLANAAILERIETYLYLIDDGVYNLGDPAIDALKNSGVRLFACAYGAKQRGIPIDNKAVFSGLVVLSNMIKGCDRFITFN